MFTELLPGNALIKYVTILKLLRNVLTAAIETLVVSGNKFLYVCVKNVCRL
jgi:hypothetical protein